jgi:hypothetical protein
MWAFGPRRHQGRPHNVNDVIVMRRTPGDASDVCPFTEHGDAEG